MNKRDRLAFVCVAAVITVILLALVPSSPLMRVVFSDQYAASWPFWLPTTLPSAELAKGKFLVASRELIDPNFSETVVLLIEYEQYGAMGVVLNRPTEVKLATVLPDMEEVQKQTDTVSIGGPVARTQMLLLIRSGSPPKETQHVFGDVYIGASRTLLQRLMTEAKARKQVRVYAGYAGWGPGQLDQEVARGDWLVLPADAEVVFDKAPAEIWLELIRRGEIQQVNCRDEGLTTVPAHCRPNRWANTSLSLPYAGDAGQVEGDPYDPGR